MNSSFGGPNNSPSGLSSKKALFDERDLVQKFIPTHSSKHPDVIHHNIQRQFDLLFLHNFHKTVGNPMIDFSRILALFMGLREHHNCLHESKDTTPLANCHECLTLLFNEIQDASAYVCEVLNEAREKQPKVFGWEEKASSFDSDEGFFVEGAMPCKNPSSRQRGRKPTTPQPSPSPSQSQSVSLSARQSNKKAFQPTSRRFEPNPPSLIITRIQDRKLLSQNRSHFKQAWNDLCGEVFPSGNTPRKFSFDNIDVIEQQRSSITISFVERPKLKQLEYFVYCSRKNQWGFVSIFNPHYRNDSPLKQFQSQRINPRQSLQQQPQHAYTTPPQRRSRPFFGTQHQQQSMPFTPPTFSSTQQPFNMFQFSNATQRRLMNVELKLDYFIQLLSHQVPLDWT